MKIYVSHNALAVHTPAYVVISIATSRFGFAGWIRKGRATDARW
jgi:hypothetical protein